MSLYFFTVNSNFLEKAKIGKKSLFLKAPWSDKYIFTTV